MNVYVRQKRESEIRPQSSSMDLDRLAQEYYWASPWW